MKVLSFRSRFLKAGFVVSLLCFLFSFSQTALAAYPNDEVGCFYNYQSWTSSSTYDNTNNWDLKFIPSISFERAPNYPEYAEDTKANYIEQFLDINGDGLVDYLYSFHGREYDNKTYWAIRDCVMLNTGTGWEVVHKCVGNYDSGYTYYGDCAQQ